jgi:hypothetical protein
VDEVCEADQRSVGIPRASNTLGTAKVDLIRPFNLLAVNAQAVGIDTRTGRLAFSQGLRLFCW